jgi:cystathionine beta-lyase
VLAGVAVTRTPKWGKRLKFIQNTFGAVLGVQDSWLLLRSLKTLGVRMETAQKSAEIIAREILYFPGVKKVHHPSLEEHPGREIHFRQAKGGGAVLSFELKNKEFAMAFMKSIELPLLAVSLGGVESILTYPATMSHAAIPENIRKARGITDALVRLSVGLEAPEDLLRDIKQALKKAAFLQGKK